MNANLNENPQREKNIPMNCLYIKEATGEVMFQTKIDANLWEHILIDNEEYYVAEKKLILQENKKLIYCGKVVPE